MLLTSILLTTIHTGTTIYMTIPTTVPSADWYLIDWIYWIIQTSQLGSHESEMKYQFSDTIEGACNLVESSLELWAWQSPKTGTAMKHEDGAIYLDVPAPANGRRYVPRSSTGVDSNLIATPELDDVTSSLSTGFLWSCYTSEVLSPYNISNRRRSPAAGPTG